MKLARTLIFASRFVDALLVATVATVLGCIVLTGIVPRLGHPVLIIRGGSMEPAIPLGSLIVLDPGVPADLRVGDVVSFATSNGTTVTHRVARLARIGATPYFATKGDANADPDPVITPASAIIGRVAWSVPGAGYLQTMLGVPIGFLAIFLTSATLLCLALLLDELAYERRQQLRQLAPVGALTISRTPLGGGS